MYTAGISSKIIAIINFFVTDIFERVETESSRPAHFNKKSTITFREIQTAIRLLLPGEHAVSEGTKAVTKFASLNAFVYFSFAVHLYSVWSFTLILNPMLYCL